MTCPGGVSKSYHRFKRAKSACLRLGSGGFALAGGGFELPRSPDACDHGPVDQGGHRGAAKREELRLADGDLLMGLCVLQPSGRRHRRPPEPQMADHRQPRSVVVGHADDGAGRELPPALRVARHHGRERGALHADRLSRKWLIIASLGVWSLVTLMMGRAANFHQLFALRAIMGVSEALYMPAGLALIRS